MVTLKSAKCKGAQMEIDSEHSLRVKYTDIRRMGGEGQHTQYDLRSDLFKSVFECKRLAGISWNQAVKYFLKLEHFAPPDFKSYLLFKSNHQPCLVMYRALVSGMICVAEFDYYFGVRFEKHKSMKKKRGGDDGQ